MNDAAVADRAQSLVALMALPFALAPALVFRRSRQPFVAHIAFSLRTAAMATFLGYRLFLLLVTLDAT